MSLLKIINEEIKKTLIEDAESDISYNKEAYRIQNKIFKYIQDNKIKFELLGDNDNLLSTRNEKIPIHGIKFNLNQIEKKYDINIIFCEEINSTSRAGFSRSLNCIFFYIFDRQYVNMTVFPEDRLPRQEFTIDDYYYYLRIRYKSWIMDDNIFVHEFIHYLDSIRYDKTYISKFPKDEYNYFNSPEEYNAYTQQLIGEILKNKRKFTGISFKMFINRALQLCYDGFIENLNDEYKKKLINRLYKIYTQLNNTKK